MSLKYACSELEKEGGGEQLISINVIIKFKCASFVANFVVITVDAVKPTEMAPFTDVIFLLCS